MHSTVSRVPLMTGFPVMIAGSHAIRSSNCWSFIGEFSQRLASTGGYKRAVHGPAAAASSGLPAAPAPHRFHNTKNQFWANTGRSAVSMSSSTLKPGDEGPRIAEPCRQRVGGVARDDVGAAAFHDREARRQEPLDAGPREEAAVLEDWLPEPGIDLPDKEFDPGKRVGQMEHEQRATGLQHAGEFHERRPLVAVGLVHMFEHADAHSRVKEGVGKRQAHGIVVTHVLEERFADERGGGFFE